MPRAPLCAEILKCFALNGIDKTHICKRDSKAIEFGTFLKSQRGV